MILTKVLIKMLTLKKNIFLRMITKKNITKFLKYLRIQRDKYKINFKIFNNS